MNRLLIDTNIVIDLLAKREKFHEESAELFSRADKKQLTLSISSLTLANTNYILTKLTSTKEAKQIIRKFKVLIELLSLDNKITELALNDDDFSDFENGLQYYTAMENEIDVIISRNKKDFKSSKIPILTAKEFLARI